MVPIQVTTFDETYEAYKEHYIYSYGKKKYDKTYDVIMNSNKMNKMFRDSFSTGVIPTARDILIEIHSIGYFIMAKNVTRGLGAIIALKYWNDNYNKRYGLIEPFEMDDKIKSTLKQLSLIW